MLARLNRAWSNIATSFFHRFHKTKHLANVAWLLYKLQVLLSTEFLRCWNIVVFLRCQLLGFSTNNDWRLRYICPRFLLQRSAVSPSPDFMNLACCEHVRFIHLIINGATPPQTWVTCRCHLDLKVIVTCIFIYVFSLDGCIVSFHAKLIKEWIDVLGLHLGLVVLHSGPMV